MKKLSTIALALLLCGGAAFSLPAEAQAMTEISAPQSNAELAQTFIDAYKSEMNGAAMQKQVQDTGMFSKVRAYNQGKVITTEFTLTDILDLGQLSADEKNALMDSMKQGVKQEMTPEIINLVKSMGVSIKVVMKDTKGHSISAVVL